MKETAKILLTCLAASFVLMSCVNFQGITVRNVEAQGGGDIDRRSYNLGGIGAFAEMVGAGVKELALSSPLPPDEMDGLVDAAEEIAARNGVRIYREDDFMVTDLFSAELTDGMDVLFIYKGDTLAKYMALKTKKAELIASGRYVGDEREGIARSFGRLLSYPKEKIDAELKDH